MTEQPLGYLQAARLAAGVFFGDIQPRLGGAQGKVGVGHLRTQQQHGIGVIGLGGEVGGVGAFDGAAEAPPEVDFPADVEARAGLPEHRITSSGGAGLVLLQVQALGAQLLQLWITPGLHDGQLGAGFGNAQAGHAQVAVVGIGLGDQGIQGRVGEHGPPLAQVGRRGLLPGLLQQRGVPGAQPRVLRRLEIRADLGTAHQRGSQAQCTTTEASGHGRPWLTPTARRGFPAPAAPPTARTVHK
ncbi:hypothetical protein D3C81_1403290 [compost metagenome]